MTNLYYEKDVKSNYLKDLTIAIIGYGSQGHAQANNMKDSGLNVIIGVRPNGISWKKAQKDGFNVYSISTAVRNADIIHILIPDECQEKIYQECIHDYLKEGATLSFSSGFSIHYKKIIAPQNVNIILFAPKGPGPSVRSQYLKGSGVPGLLAVHQDFTGNAKEISLEMAKACGATKVGVLKTTMKDEIETDLFGEQTILVGGLVELMIASFNTLINAGYREENAYFETVHELKLIVDIIYRDGIAGMLNAVSNTAKYGWLFSGKKIITDDTVLELENVLKRIQSKEFLSEWDSEYSNGLKNLNENMKIIESMQIEKVGTRVRKLIQEK